MSAVGVGRQAGKVRGLTGPNRMARWSRVGGTWAEVRGPYAVWEG